jgi:hypothetical protein
MGRKKPRIERMRRMGFVVVYRISSSSMRAGISGGAPQKAGISLFSASSASLR